MLPSSQPGEAAGEDSLTDARLSTEEAARKAHVNESGSPHAEALEPPFAPGKEEERTSGSTRIGLRRIVKE